MLLYIVTVDYVPLRSVTLLYITFRLDPARKLYDIYHCCVYSEKLLMMDKGTVRNMYSFIPKINLRN